VNVATHMARHAGMNSLEEIAFLDDNDVDPCWLPEFTRLSSLMDAVMNILQTSSHRTCLHSVMRKEIGST
jgi:hypothetical protein